MRGRAMPLPANERILSGAGFHDTHENIKNAGNLAGKPEVGEMSVQQP